MSEAVNNLVALALALTPSGEIGDGMVARFHELAREVIDEGKPESADAALAIGEHAFVKGKEIDLVRLIEVLTASLINDGNCKVEAGCWSEGMSPPSITRSEKHGLCFDFYGVPLSEGEKVIWGES